MVSHNGKTNGKLHLIIFTFYNKNLASSATMQVNPQEILKEIRHDDKWLLMSKILMPERERERERERFRRYISNYKRGHYITLHYIK